MIIAIQPDSADPDDERTNGSSRYAAILEKAGHHVRWVDIRRSDIIDQLRGCDGFIWRQGAGTMVQIARHVLPVLERELGLAMYPDQRTCWHFDDRIAQKYLFDAHHIPTPFTWVHWDDLDATLTWATHASYPLVLKLASDGASRSVRLIRSFAEVEPWVRRLMGDGVFTLDEAGHRTPGGRMSSYHRSYVFLQEFLPGNDFDTRVAVVGGRAFACRRFGGAVDAAANGGARADYDQAAISASAIRTALDAARRLGAQSLVFELMRRAAEFVVVEASVAGASRLVHDAPGHWTVDGDPLAGPLTFHEGRMRSEDAEMADYLIRLEARRGEDAVSRALLSAVQ